jgi:hypothetical protein
MSEKNMKDSFSIRLESRLYKFINDLAKSERRKPTEVARLLLELGIDRFQREGKLIIVKPGEAKPRATG